MQRGTFARRAAVGLATLAMIAAASGETTAPPRTDGPFNVLEWADGVTTSRSGYAVWVSLRSTHHRVQMPGYTREVTPPEHGATLHVACRARGGDLPGRFPPTGPQGGIYLENHPEDPGVYTVLHPMHWILALSGHDKERWPVQIRIGRGETMTSDLVRARIDYSAPRPGLDIALPGPRDPRGDPCRRPNRGVRARRRDAPERALQRIGERTPGRRRDAQRLRQGAGWSAPIRRSSGTTGLGAAPESRSARRERDTDTKSRLCTRLAALPSLRLPAGRHRSNPPGRPVSGRGLTAAGRDRWGAEPIPGVGAETRDTERAHGERGAAIPIVTISIATEARS